MAIQDSLDQLYAEMANRWIRLTGTGDPNSDVSLDNAPVGTIYTKTGVDPVLIYLKNRIGSSGWDLFVQT